MLGYRNWYQYWGHCCLINDLGSSPQPEGEAPGLWWASQVVNETTMTEIEVSISMLWWWNYINDEYTNTVNSNAQICPKTVPGYSMVTCAHPGVLWPDCVSLVTRVATTVMQSKVCYYTLNFNCSLNEIGNKIAIIILGKQIKINQNVLIRWYFENTNDLQRINCLILNTPVFYLIFVIIILISIFFLKHSQSWV